ncbi:hypothetical protein TWF506_004447 [Arthrobotrys conoides]|uniref:Peptidase S8/S53 domain-containing protein n=1 Tax=Arthrobotrys conoides TaxID=74498 RepID=A0AAN8N346_9PEZI
MAFTAFVRLLVLLTSLLLIQKSIGIAVEGARTSGLPSARLDKPARNNQSSHSLARRGDQAHWIKVLSKFDWPGDFEWTRKINVAILFTDKAREDPSYAEKFDKEIKEFLGKDVYERKKDGSYTGVCADWNKNNRAFCTFKDIKIDSFVDFISLNDWLVKGMESVMEGETLLALRSKLNSDMSARIYEILGSRPPVREQTLHARSEEGQGVTPRHTHDMASKDGGASGMSKLKKRAAVKMPDSTFDVRMLAAPPLSPRGRTRLEIQTGGVPEHAWLEQSQGEGVSIYILSTGFFTAAENHPEFVKSVKTEKRIKGWLGERIIGDSQSDFDLLATIDEPPIGTGIVSKILGRRAGLAKKADVYLAPYADKGWEGLWPALVFVEQLLSIRGHFLLKKKEDPGYKAVVHLAPEIIEYRTVIQQQTYYKDYQITKNEEAWIRRVSWLVDTALTLLLKEPETSDLIAVASSGGLPKGTPILSWPALNADNYDNLVIVGSVDNSGHIIYDEETDFVKVYAVSAGIEVPYVRQPHKADVVYSGYESISSVQGHHYASAAVAGILATHRSANPDLTGADAIKKLYNDAYPRVRGGPKVAWTGARPPTKPCKRERQDEEESSSQKPKLEDFDCVDEPESDKDAARPDKDAARPESDKDAARPDKDAARPESDKDAARPDKDAPSE